jgi:hypothetical protein
VRPVARRDRSERRKSDRTCALLNDSASSIVLSSAPPRAIWPNTCRTRSNRVVMRPHPCIRR